MLFSKSKDKEKNGPFVLDASNDIEEETVRRWRDIAARRNQRSLFEDSDEDLNYPSPHTVAAQWPSEAQAVDAGAYSLDPIDDVRTIELQDGIEDIQFSTPRAFERNDVFGHSEPEYHGIHGRSFEADAQVFEEQEHHHLAAKPVIHEQPETKVKPLNAIQSAEQSSTRSIEAPTTTPAATLLSDLSLPIEQDLKRRFGTNIKSALGPGTVIEGTFRFDSPVCVDGTLTGEITSTSALIVGADASINGRIKVGSLIVLGTVNGTVEATELVEIRRGGMLDGDLSTERIVIEDGGWFEGSVRMTPKPEA